LRRVWRLGVRLLRNRARLLAFLRIVSSLSGFWGNAKWVVLGKVIQDAELPPGVLNLIYGAGNPAGAALVKHPRVRGVSFTGGTATGIQIRRDTVEDIGKHISLELGGKNPTLVFEDVDVDAAVATAARAAFENQGEVGALSNTSVKTNEIDLPLWLEDLRPKIHLRRLPIPLRRLCPGTLRPRADRRRHRLPRPLPQDPLVSLPSDPIPG
jgi:hypothetical protein